MFKTEEEYGAAVLGIMREQMWVFFSIEACKPVIEVTQNTIWNLKIC